MHQFCRIALLSSLAVGRFANADVVYSNANTSSSVSAYVNHSYGQTFTNTGPTGTIQSVTVYLRNSGGATGNIGIGIRTILSGTPGLDAVYNGTAAGLIASSATISSATISNTITAVTFTGFTGSNTTLTTGTSYFFILNAATLTSTNPIELFYGSTVSGQNSISTAAPITPDASNDLAGQVVTAVPEPGTLALGGMAATFGGLFFRFRKKKRHQPESVEDGRYPSV